MTRNCLVAEKGKAAYCYQGMPKPEGDRAILTFNVGDVIELLSTDDANWWEVKLSTLFHAENMFVVCNDYYSVCV